MHSIVPDGSAANAGLLSGDVLLALDGTATSGPDVVLRLLTADRIGVELSARILRSGHIVELNVTPARRPTEQRRGDLSRRAG